MISTGTLRVVVAAALLLHGVAHLVALGALVLRTLEATPSASGPIAQSWLFPALAPRTVAAVGVPFWAASGGGFVLATLSFWGAVLPAGAWRPLAVSAAVISLVGIALCSGVWPGAASGAASVLDTAIAVVVDVAVLVALLGLHWPPPGLFGR